MSTLTRRLGLAVAILAAGHVASAQTADEILDKSIAAMGGRAAHQKITSRSTLGTLLLSTPAGDIPGTIEILNATPNKTRTVIKADLSSLGVGQLLIDQRFDGSTGYILDSLQGNREMSGGQLASLKNGSFPHPFLTYKEMGAAVELKGKEKVGDREAFLLIVTPKTGSEVRQYIDATTFLPMRMIAKVEVPQLGQELEQTTEFSDYRDVDGIKLPFKVQVSSTVQNFTITITSVHHNVEVDQTLFVKPATP